jgi:hypothetical protein
MPRITMGLLDTLIERMEDDLGFSERVGWIQVDGAPPKVQRDYGRYDALCELRSNGSIWRECGPAMSRHVNRGDD